MFFLSLLFLFAAEPQTVSGEVTTVRFSPPGDVVQLWVKDGKDDRRVYVGRNDTKLLWDTGVSVAPVTLKQVVGRLAEKKAEVTVTLKPNEAFVAVEAVFKEKK